VTGVIVTTRGQNNVIMRGNEEIFYRFHEFAITYISSYV
jgi:hypothetical protein